MNTIEKYDEYVNTAFMAAVEPVVIERADGSTYWDKEGNTYIDCFSGISVVNVGHSNKAVIDAAKAQIEKLVHKSGVKEGLCLVNAMHITASVFINDDEKGLHKDFEKWLELLAPHAPTSKYDHNKTGEDNADAHLKRQVMGREVVVAITDGELDFGPWEQIFYGEFDGKRSKRVLVKIIGE